MGSQMRAVDIKGGKGGADALFIAVVPRPQPQNSEALIRVKAFGLNRMDILQREGLYPVPPQASKILGVEFSGIVEEIGQGVGETFKIGDSVFGLAYGGAYSEYIAVSTKMLLPKPTFLSWEEAAGIPETWITATQALYLIGGFDAGKSVLWHAGASSVSIAGIQLAIADGASAVYVTSRTPEKIDWCIKHLGATAGFNTANKNDWAHDLLAATSGEGVDIIIDFMAASTFQGNLDAAARDCHIVNLGQLGGAVLPSGVDLSSFVKKRIRYEGSSLRSRDPEYQGKLRDKLEKYLPHFEDGSFKIHVEKIFRWEEIIDAHKLMESNQTKGKIICVIN